MSDPAAICGDGIDGRSVVATFGLRLADKLVQERWVVTRVEALCSKIRRAITWDGDGRFGCSNHLDLLIKQIVEAAREEGRRQARPPIKVRRGLETLRGIVGASCAAMMIGRENDARLSSNEQTACDNIDAACAWIEKL